MEKKEVTSVSLSGMPADSKYDFMLKYLTLLFLLLAPCEARYFNTVVIDAGHGGKDKGAYWGGVRESTLNLSVANKLAYELRARGIKVIMTRTKDVYLSKVARIRKANQYPGAPFISIHFNAHSTTAPKGIETYYLSLEGRKMAKCIHPKLVKSLKGRDRGIRNSKRYAVLTYTRAPALLAECGYISNSRERARCCTKWYQATAARVIAEGLMKYRKMR